MLSLAPVVAHSGSICPFCRIGTGMVLIPRGTTTKHLLVAPIIGD